MCYGACLPVLFGPLVERASSFDKKRQVAQRQRDLPNIAVRIQTQHSRSPSPLIISPYLLPWEEVMGVLYPRKLQASLGLSSLSSVLRDHFRVVESREQRFGRQKTACNSCLSLNELERVIALFGQQGQRDQVQPTD